MIYIINYVVGGFTYSNQARTSRHPLISASFFEHHCHAVFFSSHFLLFTNFFIIKDEKKKDKKTSFSGEHEVLQKFTISSTYIQILMSSEGNELETCYNLNREWLFIIGLIPTNINVTKWKSNFPKIWFVYLSFPRCLLDDHDSGPSFKIKIILQKIQKCHQGN